MSLKFLDYNSSIDQETHVRTQIHVSRSGYPGVCVPDVPGISCPSLF